MAGRRKRKATDKPRAVSAATFKEQNTANLRLLNRMSQAKISLARELGRARIGGGDLLRQARFARTKRGRRLFARVAATFKVAKTGSGRGR